MLPVLYQCDPVPRGMGQNKSNLHPLNLTKSRFFPAKRVSFKMLFSRRKGLSLKSECADVLHIFWGVTPRDLGLVSRLAAWIFIEGYNRVFSNQ